jgi:hypothetical protein
MSRIDSRHWKISTGHHFQNGHHNTAKIQHCPISSKFDMWVDNDVPNWFPTLKNFYRSPTHIWNVFEIGQCWICAVLWWPFWKWWPVEIFRCQESIRDIIIYHMWVDNDVPNWFPTLKNFYWLPFSKWPPQYRKNSTLSDIIILKTQSCSSNGDISPRQILCLFHYPFRIYQHQCMKFQLSHRIL